MSYGIHTIKVHKKLKLDKRANSSNWYARLTLDNGKRIVRSTKTEDFEQAKERALELYYDTRARIKNKLPAQTRKFKHVAEFAVQRMQNELDDGYGKQAYKDYISALTRWLIPYFGSTDIDKIDLAALTAFDQWRTQQHSKPFSQSGINNHNAALNRVLDEAELNGWIVKSMRPTLLNKGTKSESRGSFTTSEYTKIHTKLRTWHETTKNEKAAATREVLRNYVLFLANTGVRHGTEALGLRWRHIEWQNINGERYLVVNVDGKTRKRAAVARDRVDTYLDRQRELNTAISADSFDKLLTQRNDEFVFTTRLGAVADIFNLNRAFNGLLDEMGLKLGADGKTRTLYSLRHYYATQDLKRGMSTHALSKQMGNSTAMLDKHYSKYSPIINAEMHSGRNVQAAVEPVAKTAKMGVVEVAFAMLAGGKLDEAQLLASIGVGRGGYVVTEDIAMKAMAAKGEDLITGDTLLRILNG
jgi:integrase